MQTATINDATLEYETTGSGEPVLFISPVLADGFAPLLRHPALAERFELIHYHRRGWVGSTHTPGPVTIGDHVADAAVLLDHLGHRRVHLVGHSSGAAIAMQLAVDAPERVASATLLELSLLTLPEGRAFLAAAGPVLELYGSGDHETAFATFMSEVSGLDRDRCMALLEACEPGMVAQSVRDADTFFGIELPSLAGWELDIEDARSIRVPVLSVLGSDTRPLWAEVADHLRATIPTLEECVVDGAGHLLHIQQPDAVAHGIAGFLAAHSMAPV